MNGPAGSYLLFTLGDENYALDLQQVAEVGEPPALWPVPGAPSFCVGAMNFHGSIVAVVDLSRLLGSGDDRYPREKNIVLAPEVGGLSLLVGSVERMVPAASVTVRDSDIDGISGRYIVTMGEEALLLDAGRLVAQAADMING